MDGKPECMMDRMGLYLWCRCALDYKETEDREERDRDRKKEKRKERKKERERERARRDNSDELNQYEFADIDERE